MSDGDARNDASERIASLARDVKVCSFTAAGCTGLALLVLMIVEVFVARDDLEKANEFVPLMGIMGCSALVAALAGLARAVQVGKATGWFYRAPVFRWLVRLRPDMRFGWNYPIWLSTSAVVTVIAWTQITDHACEGLALMGRSDLWVRLHEHADFLSIYHFRGRNPSMQIFSLQSHDTYWDGKDNYQKFCEWRRVERLLKQDPPTWYREVDVPALNQAVYNARETLAAAEEASEEHKREIVQVLIDKKFLRSDRLTDLTRTKLIREGDRVLMSDLYKGGVWEGQSIHVFYLNTDQYSHAWVAHDPGRGAPSARIPPPWWVHARPWQVILFIAWLVLLSPFAFLRTPEGQ